MSEELEQSNSDVSSEVSSEPQEKAVENTSEASQEASNNNNQKENTPFHEHPRFKELIEQKNEFATRATNFEKELSELRSRFEQQSQNSQAQQKKEDELVTRLKQIDPEFGGRMEEMQAKLGKLDQFEDWIKQATQQNMQQQAETSMSALHETNKVAASLRPFYERQIRDIATSNPKLSIQDLPKVYKQVHDEYSKLFEDFRRTERQSYVQSKKQDASSPTAPKGQSIPKPEKFQYSKDEGEAKQQMIERILKLSKAGKSI